MRIRLTFNDQSDLEFDGTAQEWQQFHEAVPDLDCLMKVRPSVRPPVRPDCSDLSVRLPSDLSVRPSAPFPPPPEVIEAEARTVLPPPPLPGTMPLALPPAPRKSSPWKIIMLGLLLLGGIGAGIAIAIQRQSIPQAPALKSTASPQWKPAPKQSKEKQKVVCVPLPATKPPECK